MTYTEPGQVGGGTPTVMNDWIIDNTNGLTAPMSVVAVSQADGRMTSIQPNTTLPAGQKEHVRGEAHRRPGQQSHLHV